MAFIFEQATLSAATNTTIVTVGALQKAIYDINISNHGTGTATVNLSVTDGSTVTYLEHGVEIPLGTPLVRTKEMFPAGALIKAESDIADVDITLAGIEEDA